MNKLADKIAYLKGLSVGLEISSGKKSILATALIDVLNETVNSLRDMEEKQESILQILERNTYEIDKIKKTKKSHSQAELDYNKSEYYSQNSRISEFDSRNTFHNSSQDIRKEEQDDKQSLLAWKDDSENNKFSENKLEKICKRCGCFVEIDLNKSITKKPNLRCHNCKGFVMSPDEFYEASSKISANYNLAGSNQETDFRYPDIPNYREDEFEDESDLIFDDFSELPNLPKFGEKDTFEDEMFKWEQDEKEKDRDNSQKKEQEAKTIEDIKNKQNLNFEDDYKKDKENKAIEILKILKRSFRKRR